MDNGIGIILCDYQREIIRRNRATTRRRLRRERIERFVDSVRDGVMRLVSYIV
jgi:hypothetical protein